MVCGYLLLQVFLLNIQVDCTKMKRFLLGIYKYRNKKDDNDKELL